MRMATQVVAAAILIAAVGGGWYFWQSSAATGPQTQFGGPGGQGPPGARRPGGRQGPPGGPEVVAATAERGAIIDTVEAVGNARANEAVVITAKQAGFVARVHFEEGQRVKEGDVLVELEARERKADLETARAQYDEVSRTLDRTRQLRATGNATAARVDDLEAQARAAQARVASAEARRIDLTVVAPFAGRVGMRQVSPGALVPPGASITTLDDLSVIKVEFAVPQTVLGHIRPGLNVRARTSALKGREFVGTISVVDTRVDPVTRSVRVIAKFDNRDEALKPGLFLDVELEIGRRVDAILIQEEAVIALGTTQYVYKIVDNRAVRTEVTLGSRKPGYVEVVRGVDAGESVIVRGLQKVRDGQPVRIPKVEKTEPPPEPKPPQTSQS
jgi:membrane fusion protein (multidrug efflux system)